MLHPIKHLLLTTIEAVVLVGCGGSNPEADKALMNDIIAGDIASVKQDLADGANVNAISGSGNNSLHSAAVHGHKEIVELFIANGANVNEVGDLGRTPLDWASEKEIKDILRKHGGKTGKELKSENFENIKRQ
ncbi:MAG: hypothetical protein CMI32_06845 [Opitutales bacterium]|nr:hypothetical protein [Opitutales bacterium]